MRRLILSCFEFNINISPIHDGFCVPFYTSDMLIYLANDAFKINEVSFLGVNMPVFGKLNSNFILI